MAVPVTRPARALRVPSLSLSLHPGGLELLLRSLRPAPPRAGGLIPSMWVKIFTLFSVPRLNPQQWEAGTALQDARARMWCSYIKWSPVSALYSQA